MRKKTAVAVLTVGLLGGGGAALLVPGVAAAAGTSTTADSSATDRAAARVTSIKNALKGLVTDGTLTQAQADKVAGTLSTADLGGGHGGKGGHLTPDAVAKVIGITADQLRTAEQSGQTLTQIAAAHQVLKADLISGLVAAAKAELAAEVKAGKLTQAQSDQMSSDLTTQITARVDQAGGFGHGHGHGRDGDNDDNSGTSTPTPSATSS